MKGTLKKLSVCALMTKALKSGNPMRDQSVCFGMAFLITVNYQNKVYMVGHDYIFVHTDAFYAISGKDILFYQLSQWTQLYFRGVEGAAPYDLGKQLSLFLGADGNKICTGRRVIVKRQSGRFSFWEVHVQTFPISKANVLRRGRFLCSRRKGILSCVGGGAYDAPGKCTFVMSKGRCVIVNYPLSTVNFSAPWRAGRSAPFPRWLPWGLRPSGRWRSPRGSSPTPAARRWPGRRCLPAGA